MTSASPTIQIRQAAVDDGPAADRLIRNSPPLDPNSRYLYLLLGHHFGDTCAVAESEGRVVGFASIYIPPRQPDTLFVWQIVVDSSMRGHGLAGRMLDDVLEREACRAVRFIESTVNPSNKAVQAFFEKWAKRHDAPFEKGLWFPARLFNGDGDGGDHEDEVGYRIGPISQR